MWWRRAVIITVCLALATSVLLLSNSHLNVHNVNQSWVLQLMPTHIGLEDGEEGSSSDYTEPTEPELVNLPQRCRINAGQRVGYLRRWCDSSLTNQSLSQALDHLSTSQLSSLYVNEEHRVVYCRIPKTGCTNWKKYFILLSGKTNYTRISQILGADAHFELFSQTVRSLTSYSIVEQKRILTDYFKFLVVRHPLTRLLSAYRNKFAQHNPVFAYTSQLVLRHNNSTDINRTATFAEFLKYVTDNAGTNINSNPHWATYQELCLPCSIQYDYIAQVETIAEDSRFILKHINGSYEFPILPSTTDSRVNSEYSVLPPALLRQVLTTYSHDFHAFQYDCSWPTDCP